MTFWILAPIMVVAALGILFVRKAVHAAMLAWVGFGVSRSRWASTIAPMAAVISRALVASKAKT